MSRRVITQIDWADFSGDKVFISACMRSPSVQGRNWTTMLDAVRERVDAVHIVICDTLDRFNLKGGREEALKLSAEWQAENMHEVYSRFSQTSITFWDELLGRDEFKRNHAALRNLYETNDTVRQIITENVNLYLKPKAARSDGLDYDREFLNSVDYLLEEYAVLPLCKKMAGAEVYCGACIDDPDAFQRHTPKGVDLTLPTVLPVYNNRLCGRLIPTLCDG